ncbi:MAG: hypothetical protein JWO04_71 [Gammaproteobacteria bacterium]|jgi:hypothetical protein|nr:hypothetical protein [Gammaproteobacteria bacterium]
MSNVAEGRAGCRRIGAIDQEDAFTGFGQRPGNGTAHYASANDGNIVRGGKAVPADANHGDFVLAHLRLAYRGS